MTISTQAPRTGQAATLPAGFALKHSKGSLLLPVRPATEGPSGLERSYVPVEHR